MIPHVTQFDEADVTDLEQFRVDSNAALAKARSRRQADHAGLRHQGQRRRAEEVPAIQCLARAKTAPT
jgi:pyruvate/2-oxoglutarate dehydrogenase complex dihydrolipoamide acyltransferase (E2) component